MNTAIKKLCVFGLAAGVGEMIYNQTDNDRAKWRARKLAEAGNDAINNLSVKIDNSAIRRVKRKIDEVYTDKEQYDIRDMLCFLLAALDDLDQHTDGNNDIATLCKRAAWFNSLYDPKTDSFDIYADAARRYEAWVK